MIDSITMVSSFDIFDTCLVRKCGVPENFFDVFSLRAFNGKVEETTRQEFVAARLIAQQQIQSCTMTLRNIYDNFQWRHPLLKPVDELYQLELSTERDMLVPVLKIRDKVNECRQKGHRIIYISDMYLPSDFLTGILWEHGFIQDGDNLYVSCECGAEKWDGSLFMYVKEKENLSYHRWHHYGDNKYADYKTPHKLGIHTTLVNHEYTLYQSQWIKNDYSLGYKYPSILAGIGHALRFSTEWTTHTDFVIDIIAPFYCSLVYRMMRDAELRGINRLYFCARDAYMMYLIAQKYKPFFPNIECKFLYISKKSLYEGNDDLKLAYFVQEGLASTTDYVGFVDVRSSGKTLQYLNLWLQAKNYLPVRGYYFEMFLTKDEQYFSTDYYAEVNTAYINHYRMVAYGLVYEVFFSLNKLRRTIGYTFLKDKVVPIFDDQEEKETSILERMCIDNHDYWTEFHKTLLMTYADWYIEFVSMFSDRIFENNVAPTLIKFFTHPNPQYLSALDGITMYKLIGDEIVHTELIKKESLFTLIRTRGKDSFWKRGTLSYSLPQWLYKLLFSLTHNN